MNGRYSSGHDARAAGEIDMMFPVLKFWRYTPWGWCAACIWNISELIGVGLPHANLFFDVIMGKAGKRI